MKRIVVVLLVLAACDEVKLKPEVKLECETTLKHLVTISPRNEGRNPDQVVADLPIEDLQSCSATFPEIRACFRAAADVEAVVKCFPPDKIFGCMATADGAKDKALEDAKDKGIAEKDVEVRPFDDARRKCYAGDEHAADAYKEK